MLRIAVTILLVMCFEASGVPVFAESVPQEALDKDYEACMGGQTEQEAPDRSEYCNCVRTGMQHWDADIYSNAVTEQAQAGMARVASSKVEELANTCLAKALH